MTQLVKRSLPIPEVRGSNAVISKKNIEHLLYLKDENKGKEGENYPFLIEVATACAKLRLSILLIHSCSVLCDFFFCLAVFGLKSVKTKKDLLNQSLLNILYYIKNK